MMQPSLTLKTTPERTQVILNGSWAGVFLGKAEELLHQVLPQLSQKSFDLVLDCVVLDSNGAYLLSSTLQSCTYAPQGPAKLISLLKDSPTFLKTPISSAQPMQWYQIVLEGIGRHVCFLGTIGKNLLAFFGEVIVLLLSSFRQIRWQSVTRHIEDFGVKALPIIALISFLIGTVLAYQGINQLSRFGAEIFTVDFLGIGILREIGVLLTSIVIAGRTGSSITAQIGIMKLNQEIDAIRIMGLNPVNVLVIPRLLALFIVLPLLVFFSDIMGLFGGMVLTKFVINLPTMQYLEQLQKALSPTHFWVGMSKAPLFALIIVIVGCFRGLQVKDSAESVGEMTTRSVVESIFLVIICDAVLSVVYSYLQI